MTISTSRRSSSDLGRPGLNVAQRAGAVRVRCSTVDDGDFHRVDVPLHDLEPRRRSLVDLPWTMLDEHHGVGVREVTRPGEHDGATGDVLVTAIDGAVLGCWAGDCASVVLIGAGRRFGVAHAGWRGLAAGVLAVAADALGEPVSAVVLGPAIGPCCYEFGHDDLQAVAAGLGVDRSRVTGRTYGGATALDVPAAVAAFAAAHGTSVTAVGGCTGCEYPGYSHRVRRDHGRHVVAVWRRGAA